MNLAFAAWLKHFQQPATSNNLKNVLCSSGHVIAVRCSILGSLPTAVIIKLDLKNLLNADL